MYLKSLEMRGFKSFPDKTVLTFGEGIAAIVGPNGSGKSNIADAIRWVLGEQSTKTLRGARMEDVIFAGTQSRGPVGYAEVSLILDNSDGTLPIDASEVMVTRRYFRSGESEYYINKSSVRLRDIHELFMDTGLGRDGYSIIGQGRIDEILSVKSVDRREIFEEAAGISKFRYRKEEAERKLLATETNLIRINDKISELELSVGPLKEQAEKAQRYLNLRDELRGLEVTVWLANLEKIKANAQEVRKDYEDVTRQLENEKLQLESLYRQSEELSERMREKDTEIETGRNERSRLEEELAGVESDIAVLVSTKENINENISRLEEEISEQSGRAGNLDTQIENNVKRVEFIEKQILDIDVEIARLEQESRELTGSADELSQRIDSLGVREIAEENSANRLRMELKALESASAELGRRREDLDRDLGGRQEATLALIRQRDEAEVLLSQEKEKASSLNNVISGYEIRLQNRQKKLDTANKEYNRLSMELRAQQDRKKLLTDLERDYGGYSHAVKVVMQASEKGTLSGVRGPLSKLIKVSDEHAVAIETALGAGLQNIVVDDEQDAKAAINMLKRSDGGRATFLPITAIRGRKLDTALEGERGFIGIASDLVQTGNEYREIVENALGRTAIADNLDSAIAIAKKHGYRFRVVTLDGQVVNAGGSMTGGSNSNNTGILVRANELERLEKEIKTTEEQLRQADSVYKEIKREVTAAEYELEVARSEHRLAEEVVLKAEGQLSVLASRIENSLQIEENIRQELAAIEKRLSENIESSGRLAETVGRHEENRRKLLAEIEEIRSGHEELENTRGELTKKAAELREERSGYIGELQILQKSIRELEQLKGQFSADSEKRLSFIESYKERICAIEAELAQKGSEAQSLKEECNGVRDRIAELTNARMGIEAERTEVDRSAKGKNEVILRLQHELGRLEQKKNESDIYEQQIIDKLWDTYGLTRTSARAIAVEIGSLTSANRRISELKREMSDLGDVNVGAIEEYKRISERYEYLSTQRDDVEKAKKELEGIINDITAQMKVIFEKRFKEINESFSETFVEIFGGGRAHLELEDENDILNCGIEIRVQLPGKSLKTISLLSGGEKSFIAIALYFAILKIRPTPFCVLDEIDASLDDVNVMRFAKYMHKLTDNTQFILITHRRGTMEECGILYGVTMEVSGESKILALNIQDVERELGIKAI